MDIPEEFLYHFGSLIYSTGQMASSLRGYSEHYAIWDVDHFGEENDNERMCVIPSLVHNEGLAIVVEQKPLFYDIS